MSFFQGSIFFLTLILALIPAVILGFCEKSLTKYRRFLTIFFLGCIFYSKPVQMLSLCLYVCVEVSVIFWYLRHRTQNGKKENAYLLAIFLSLSPLILEKISEVSSISVFQFLGISYLTFKSIQMIIEIYDGVLTELRLLDYLDFLLFFPTFSSGPINRSRNFFADSNQVYDKEEYALLCSEGVYKILLGVIYKFLIGAIFFKAVEAIPMSKTLLYQIAYAYAYGCYMFFDFAGYSQMAIGTGYIIGIHTPENFRKPFISKDMKEFWDRWHISLSHWFRDYVFQRFMMKAIRKKWFSNRLQRAGAGFILNMFIMGIWHGLRMDYLVYGLYHGILLAVTEVYQKKSKFYKKHKKDKWYQFLSWIITMQLVMFGFYIFSGRFFATMRM